MLWKEDVAEKCICKLGTVVATGSERVKKWVYGIHDKKCDSEEKTKGVALICVKLIGKVIVCM